MEFSERFYSYLRARKDERGWQARFAKQAGITQNSLSKIISRETKNPSMETISKIVQAAGPEAFFEGAVMSRTGPQAPKELVEGDALPAVPVYGNTGAGAATGLFSGSPESFIRVLPQYNFPDVAAFRVDGDSMEPTILKGAYVGVVPFAGDIAEGGIYLVHMPPFGRVIKRLRMGADGAIVLYSDNSAYSPIPLPYEGYANVVLGRVVWIWQLC